MAAAAAIRPRDTVFFDATVAGTNAGSMATDVDVNGVATPPANDERGWV
jgi:hypothetical protein